MRIEAIVIGRSAGGLSALKQLPRGIGSPRSQAIVACSHSGDRAPGGLLSSLPAGYCLLPVRETRERFPVEPGTVYPAPPGYHLLIERDRHFALSVDGPCATPDPPSTRHSIALRSCAARTWPPWR